MSEWRQCTLGTFSVFLESGAGTCQRSQLRAWLPWPRNAMTLYLPEIPACSIWMEMFIPGRVQLPFRPADAQE